MAGTGEWNDWRAWSKVALYWALAAAFLVAVLLVVGLLVVLFGGLDFPIDEIAISNLSHYRNPACAGRA